MICRMLKKIISARGYDNKPCQAMSNSSVNKPLREARHKCDVAPTRSSH